MKQILPLLVLLALPITLNAQETPGALGAGVILGVPFGFSAKYYMDAKTALDFAFGNDSGDVAFHADLLGHLSDLFPKPKKGKLPAYFGVGIKFRDQDVPKDNFFGIRFVGGFSYLFPNHPLEFFAEIAPILRTAPDLGSNVDGGVGLRYYFTTLRAKK
ncbi:MAG: hypothetical protein HY400_03960 [Elusimicrobia bacterium]|nr:hypothetical protein [Elusimicrobiota bacterium]